MKFFGMMEPSLDEPLIEVETPDGLIVDLYNENFLRCVVRSGDELAFEFDSWADRSMTTALRFVGVRGLRVVQPRDWQLGESEQIEYFMIRREGPWQRVVFKAGGLEYEFDAAELRVVVEPAAEANAGPS